jgi:hypothetical protein
MADTKTKPKKATAAEKAADPKYHSTHADTNPKGDD